MARKMKDSGIPWVGKIPEGWEVTKTKRLLFEVKAFSSTGEELPLALTAKGGIVPFSEKTNKTLESATYVGKKIVRCGQIVLNRFKSRLFALSSYDGLVSPDYAVYGVKALANAKYLVYVFGTSGFKETANSLAFGVGDGFSRLYTSDLFKLQVPIPPLAEQKRIAEYLDKTVGRIDGLREKISREIERLGDYKKSMISEAVCRGLDKTAKMKDSGIPWVGKIPAGWEVTRGKYCLQLLNRPIKDDDGVITCFRDGEVTLRSKRREEGFTVSLKECGYQGVEPGDLVVHGMDGFAGSIGISDSRGKASPVLNVIDSNECKKYIMYYLRSMAYRDVFLALSTGIRVRSCDLRWNKLANLQYILPPLAEQKRIAEYIDKQVAKIDALIEKRKAELERLEALKRSIICECVTGKMEVAS